MNDLAKEIGILKEENKKKDLIINKLKDWKEENEKKYLIINELKEWKDKMEKEEKEKIYKIDSNNQQIKKKYKN